MSARRRASTAEQDDPDPAAAVGPVDGPAEPAEGGSAAGLEVFGEPGDTAAVTAVGPVHGRSQPDDAGAATDGLLDGAERSGDAAAVPGATPAARNEVLLVGRLSAPVEQRTLPSGDVLATWRLVVDRPPARRPLREGARPVTVDTLDCVPGPGGCGRAPVGSARATWSGCRARCGGGSGGPVPVPPAAARSRSPPSSGSYGRAEPARRPRGRGGGGPTSRRGRLLRGAWRAGCRLRRRGGRAAPTRSGAWA